MFLLCFYWQDIKEHKHNFDIEIYLIINSKNKKNEKINFNHGNRCFISSRNS